jgi:hypothetical protein
LTDSQTNGNQLKGRLAGAYFLLTVGAVVLMTGLLILANDARWWRQTGVWTDASVSHLLAYYEIDLKPLSWESAQRLFERALDTPVWLLLMGVGLLIMLASWRRRAQAKREYQRREAWLEAERMARESAE